MMIGQHKRDFKVIPYQNDWQEHFEKEAHILREALGKKALCVEHIGSTAIPGIQAKAIIDIMVGVESLSQAKELIPVLEPLRYVYRPLDRISERMYFRKGHIPEYRTYHLNLVAHESRYWKNQLAFRDYLRSHGQMATKYVELKKQIAADYARTKEIELDAKTEFVTKVLELAGKDR